MQSIMHKTRCKHNNTISISFKSFTITLLLKARALSLLSNLGVVRLHVEKLTATCINYITWFFGAIDNNYCTIINNKYTNFKSSLCIIGVSWSIGLGHYWTTPIVVTMSNVFISFFYYSM